MDVPEKLALPSNEVNAHSLVQERLAKSRENGQTSVSHAQTGDMTSPI